MKLPLFIHQVLAIWFGGKCGQSHGCGVPCGPCFLPKPFCHWSRVSKSKQHPLANYNVVSHLSCRGLERSSFPAALFPGRGTEAWPLGPGFQVRQLLACASFGKLEFSLFFVSELTTSSSELVLLHGPASSRSVLRGLRRLLISYYFITRPII